MKFSSKGVFLTAFDFGWDSTPAVVPHDDTCSIVIKDNHYGGIGLFCSDPTSPICSPLPNGPFYITRLNANLQPEWKFKNTDGSLYVLKRNGTLRHRLFLNLAIGAAYTPLSIGPDGKIYTQNDGHLFVEGDEGEQTRMTRSGNMACLPKSARGPMASDPRALSCVRLDA